VIEKAQKQVDFGSVLEEAPGSIQLQVLDCMNLFWLLFLRTLQDPVAIYEQTRQLDASRVHAAPDSDGSWMSMVGRLRCA